MRHFNRAPSLADATHMDTCTVCHTAKPTSEFVRDARRTLGYRRTCKTCHVAAQKVYTERNREAINGRARARAAALPKVSKPRRPPLPPEIRRARARDQKRVRALAAHGLTVGDYEALLRFQRNVCAICKTDNTWGRGVFAVDHDHATGAVRGLLCNSCNLALGQFRDDPSLLRAALRYLEMRH